MKKVKSFLAISFLFLFTLFSVQAIANSKLPDIKKEAAFSTPQIAVGAVMFIAAFEVFMLKVVPKHEAINQATSEALKPSNKIAARGSTFAIRTGLRQSRYINVTEATTHKTTPKTRHVSLSDRIPPRPAWN